MRLTWRDIISTLLVVGGGAIVYAKFYDYSWAMIASWRSAVAVLAIGGILMFAFSNFDFANRSLLNITEMILGFAAVILAIWGMIVASQTVFYSLAVTLGVLWLIDIARHARHSWIGEENMQPTTYNRQVHGH